MLKIGTLNADKCLVIDESIFDLTNGLTRDIPLVERLNGGEARGGPVMIPMRGTIS